MKRNNIVSRSFHNTTSLYNYQYNAAVKLKEGTNAINAAYRVPPEGFIPVWFAGTAEDAKTNTPTFDKVIEICEIALQKHNQKDNKWIDNFRYNIGKAWFYKRNYILALSNFEFVLKKYPDSKLVPLVYMWMVKCHLMDENPTLATKILEEQLAHIDLKKRERGELALVNAQVLLDQGKYEEVQRILNKNRSFIKGANNKARVSYLLGQIYQSQEQNTKAIENYKAVTKLNTDYELIFNAKLAMAKLMIADQSGGDLDKLMKMLKKMAKDEKNVDYRDRIYYEIAELYLKLDKKKTAIKHLKMSVAANTNNQRQKALSYYKIGQIYFYDLKDFPNAQVYFDSASASINAEAPEYREISTISATLKEYIGYVNTIHLQDSLLQLSKMSDKSLEEYVDKYLEAQAKRKEQDEQRRLEEMKALNDPNLFNQFGEDKGRGNNGFYFDSPDQVSSGKIKFEQSWGMRKNEDNWRRKNKTLEVITDSEGADTVKISEEEVKKYGSAEKAKMIKNVPRTEEDRILAAGKVEEALYGLGQVYQNKLQILDSAIVVYNRLVNRFPDSEYTLKARYALFKIYSDKEDESSANEQKRKICTAAPNSRYCKYCNNETFEDGSKESMENFAAAYKALLETYQRREWNTCIDFSNFIISQFPEDEGLAEVYMIRGKSYGGMGLKDSLVNIYKYTKTNYPDADVIPEINRTLAYLSGDKPAENKGQPGDNQVQPGNENPRFAGFEAVRKPNEKLYVVVTIKKEKLQTNELQQKVNDFNAKYFAEKRLNVSVFLYNNKYHMPYISQFDSEKEAAAYISALRKDMELSTLFTDEEEKAAYISPANFRTAYGKKRMEDYFLYYEEVLLSGN
ncbi:MAG: tetratricopeptide repeat protein [Bacteroidia bacterium]